MAELRTEIGSGTISTFGNSSKTSKDERKALMTSFSCNFHATRVNQTAVPVKP